MPSLEASRSCVWLIFSVSKWDISVLNGKFWEFFKLYFDLWSGSNSRNHHHAFSWIFPRLPDFFLVHQIFLKPLWCQNLWMSWIPPYSPKNLCRAWWSHCPIQSFIRADKAKNLRRKRLTLPVASLIAPLICLGRTCWWPRRFASMIPALRQPL